MSAGYNVEVLRSLAQKLRALQAAWHMSLALGVALASGIVVICVGDPGAALSTVAACTYVYMRHTQGAKVAAHFLCAGVTSITGMHLIGLAVLTADGLDSVVEHNLAIDGTNPRTTTTLCLLVGGMLGVQPVRLRLRLFTIIATVTMVFLHFVILIHRTEHVHRREMLASCSWRIGPLLAGFGGAVAIPWRFLALDSMVRALESSASKLENDAEVAATTEVDEARLLETKAASNSSRASTSLDVCSSLCSEGSGGSSSHARTVHFDGIAELEAATSERKDRHGTALDELVQHSLERLRAAHKTKFMVPDKLGEAERPAQPTAAGTTSLSRSKRPPQLSIQLAGATAGASDGACDAPAEAEALSRAFGSGNAALAPLLLARRVPTEQVVLGSIVGRGAFGTVHAGAWNRSDDGPLACADARGEVAVKVMHRYRLHPNQLDIFTRALEVELALLPHPNVCRTHAWACDPESVRLLVVMELCSSGTLAAALEAGKTKAWAWPLKLRVAQGLADGLAFLHAHEPPVVHRDLKPDNLLFDATLRCKICDLGASRQEDYSQTMTDAVGTPLFRAPEQLRHQRYGAGVDVWAASCVLVCLSLDRTQPYDELDEGLLRRLSSGEMRPALPRLCTFHTVVQGCSEFQPAERMSAAQLADALRTLCGSDPDLTPDSVLQAHLPLSTASIVC